MSLHNAVIKALQHVDVEISKLNEIRATLISLDGRPTKRRHFSAVTRRRMAAAQRKRRRKEKKASR